MILYFFSVFHKLNVNFLSQDVSCSLFFYERQVEALPFALDGEIVSVVLIYGTLLAEVAIPLLLAIRGTRSAGIMFGMAFHLLLSFNPISGFYNFSSMLILLFLLFAPEDFPRSAHDAWRKAVGRARSLHPRSPVAVVVVALGMFVALVAVSASFDYDSQEMFLALWTAYAIAILLGTFRLSARSGRSDELSVPLKHAFRVSNPVMLALPFAMFLNGLTPYIGLKTELAFSMFSNLRTEGGRTNHLLVPVSFQLFNYQRDLVRIVSSDNPRLSAYAQTDRLLPFVKFRDIVATSPESSVVYERGRERRALRRGGDHAEFSSRRRVEPSRSGGVFRSQMCVSS